MVICLIIMNSLENYEVWSFFGFVLGYKPNNERVESHNIDACLKRIKKKFHAFI